MNYSAELRWFLKNVLKEEVESIFKSEQILLTNEPVRTDWYLATCDSESSIKLRENKLEVKKMIGEPKFIQWGTNINGLCQTWAKYSIGVSVTDAAVIEIKEGKSPWFPVVKNRSIARFDMGGSSFRQVPVNMVPEEGCTLEVCSVFFNNNSWVTLCIETLGVPETAAGNLNMACNEILRKIPRNVFLDKDFSLSYPQFLSKNLY